MDVDKELCPIMKNTKIEKKKCLLEKKRKEKENFVDRSLDSDFHWNEKRGDCVEK